MTTAQRVRRLLFLVVVLTLTPYLAWVAYNRVTSDPGIPPGYELLCSPEGKYPLMVPSADGQRTFQSPTIWDSALGTKDFAWYYEKEGKKPYVPESSKYQWEPCEKPKAIPEFGQPERKKPVSTVDIDSKVFIPSETLVFYSGNLDAPVLQIYINEDGKLTIDAPAGVTEAAQLLFDHLKPMVDSYIEEKCE